MTPNTNTAIRFASFFLAIIIVGIVSSCNKVANYLSAPFLSPELTVLW